MDFRYNYTGNPNPILGPPYLEYETLFFSEKDKVWKKTKDRYDENLGKFIHDIVEVATSKKEIQKRNEYIDFNYYEYNVDIDLLLKEPIKINSLLNFITAKRTTDNYKDFISRVMKMEGINKYELSKINKLDWYGGLDFKLELGVLFPKLIEKLVIKNEKKDLEETFRFIVFDFLNINKILEKEIKEFNKIMNAKTKTNKL